MTRRFALCAKTGAEAPLIRTVSNRAETGTIESVRVFMLPLVPKWCGMSVR